MTITQRRRLGTDGPEVSAIGLSEPGPEPRAGRMRCIRSPLERRRTALRNPARPSAGGFCHLDRRSPQ